jgi:hypothetical protein
VVDSPEAAAARARRDGFHLEALLTAWVEELLAVGRFVDADQVCVRYVADFLLGMRGDCHIRDLEGRRADALLGVVA